MPTPDPRYEWLSTREAAIREGVSPSTIGRMIREGKLIAESIERPGGTMLRVRYPRTDPASEDAAPTESEATPEPRQATSEAIQAVSDGWADERAERQRLAEENANLRERVGRAEARAETSEQTITAQAETIRELRAARDDLAERLKAAEAERDLAEAKAARPWWKRW